MQIGQTTVIFLPQERTGAELVGREGDAHIFQISSHPVSKTHRFKYADFAICHRKQTPLEMIWEAEPTPHASLDDAVRSWKLRVRSARKQELRRKQHATEVEKTGDTQQRQSPQGRRRSDALVRR